MGRNTWVKQLREEDGDLVDVDGNSLSGLLDLEKKEDEPREINIGGKATVLMGKGDRLVIETPGGGAWGKIGEEGEEGLVGKGVEGVKRVKDEVVGGVRSAVEWAARGSLAERAAAQAGF